MRAIIQRVSEASVKVDGNTVGAIDQGYLILVCAMQGDTEANADKLALKISKTRIFNDKNGKMNLSLMDVGGAALIISQFTLAGDTSRGNRPGFSRAARPEEGKQLYDYFCDQVRGLDIPVETGQFGANMAVSLLNDGPVTITFDV